MILVFLAFVMLVGSFMAGIIPLVVTLSEVKNGSLTFTSFSNESSVNLSNGNRPS